MRKLESNRGGNSKAPRKPIMLYNRSKTARVKEKGEEKRKYRPKTVGGRHSVIGTLFHHTEAATAEQKIICALARSKKAPTRSAQEVRG